MFDDTAGKVITETLKDWNVEHIYGIPGDSINNLIESLRKEKEAIPFIQVRHEEVGALAAAAYAKLTGNIGVCLSIAGPGAIHLLNGLYDAKMDRVPLLVLAGQVDSASIGTDDFQEINMERLFDDVTVFNQPITNVEHLPDLLHQAIRTAYAEKGVAVLTLPDDMPLQKVKTKHKMRSDVYTNTNLFPHETDLNKACGYINEARRPVILAGKGTQAAREALATFAEKIAAPIVISLPAKGVIPDDDPYFLGNLGLIGTKPAYEAMEETDLLILAGTSFPYRDFLPKDAPAIQIDIRKTEIGKRYPVDVGLIGEANTTLQWLTEHVEAKKDRHFLQACQENMQHWREHIHQDEQIEEGPIKPQQVIPQLQRIAEDDAVLSVDVGNITVWMARHFRMTNQSFLISSWLATMGCGLPGAIGAKLAEPERQVIAVCGDGGFTMVMHDFVTAVRYQLPIIVVVLNNERLGMIKYEQQQIGHVEYETSLSGIDFAAFAEACGGEGYIVDKPEDLAATFQKASYATKPVLVDVRIQEQPPLPGKIEYGQAASYTKHMVKTFLEKGKVDMPPLKKALKRLA